MPEKLVFDHHLYVPSEVKQGAEEFAHLGTFALSDEDGATVVTISDVQEDYSHMLVDAFANYVLEASIVATRKEAGGGLL